MMMGCDIHMVLEGKFPGDSDWVGIVAYDRLPGSRLKFSQRDYGLFQRFGVRGYREDVATIYPRNLPRDVSPLAWRMYMLCPTDYHSASHCTLREFADAWRAENPDDATVRSEHVIYDLFGLWEGEEGEPEYRLVFWFDN